MLPRDTDPEVQRILDDHYRKMKPAEKGAMVRNAWRTARSLQLAGLRVQYPDESEESIEARLAERWLGRELYQRVVAFMSESGA